MSVVRGPLHATDPPALTSIPERPIRPKCAVLAHHGKCVLLLGNCCSALPVGREFFDHGVGGGTFLNDLVALADVETMSEVGSFDA